MNAPAVKVEIPAKPEEIMLVHLDYKKSQEPLKSGKTKLIAFLLGEKVEALTEEECESVGGLIQKSACFTEIKFETDIVLSERIEMNGEDGCHKRLFKEGSRFIVHRGIRRKSEHFDFVNYFAICCGEEGLCSCGEENYAITTLANVPDYSGSYENDDWGETYSYIRQNHLGLLEELGN
jgi:hypothetical protein